METDFHFPLGPSSVMSHFLSSKRFCCVTVQNAVSGFFAGKNGALTVFLRLLIGYGAVTLLFQSFANFFRYQIKRVLLQMNLTPVFGFAYAFFFRYDFLLKYYIIILQRILLSPYILPPAGQIMFAPHLALCYDMYL